MIIFIPFLLNGQKENTLEIAGIRINMDSLDINRSYHSETILSKNNSGNNDTLVRKETRSYIVSSSRNKKFIGISAVDITSHKNSYDLSFQNSTLSIYSNDNKLIFKDFMTGRRAGLCLISDNAEFIHAGWISNNDEDQNSVKLVTYNPAGERIHTIDNIDKIYHGNDINEIFYTKDASGNINDENYKTIYYHNYQTNSDWKKTFSNSPYTILIDAVSNDGKNIICIADKIYSIDNKGNILWSSSDAPGFFHFSDDAKYVEQFPRPGQLIVYDNSNGKIILRKDFVDKKSFYPYLGNFVSNTKEYILALYSNTGSEVISFFNLKGEVLQTIKISSFKDVSRIRVEVIQKNLDVYLNDQALTNKFEILW